MAHCFVIIYRPPFRGPEAARIMEEYNDNIRNQIQVIAADKGASMKELQPGLKTMIIGESFDFTKQVRQAIRDFVEENNDHFAPILAKHVVNNAWMAYISRINPHIDDALTRERKKTAETNLPTYKPSSKRTPEVTHQQQQELILILSYKTNPRLTEFLESGAEFFQGLEEFKTRHTGCATTHELIFESSEMTTLYRFKLRNINYSAKEFKYEDIGINMDTEEDVKIIFKKIKVAANDLKVRTD